MRSAYDAHRALTAPDGDDYFRQRMHSRCDPHHMIDGEPVPILCPWCEEFDGPSRALTDARELLAARRRASERLAEISRQLAALCDAGS